jgi:hypothetical protein
VSAADTLIVRDGAVAAPMDYVQPAGSEIVPVCATASFDGTGAAGAFVPTLEVIAPDGHVVARCPVQSSVAAGASADVTWFPGLGSSSPAGSSIGATTTIYHTQLAAPARTIDTGPGTIPTTFAHLQIVCRLRTTQAVINDIGVLTMNGDTGANYDRASVTWTGTAIAFSSTYGTTGMTLDTLGASATANRFATIQALFVDYADLASFKNAQASGAEIGTPADGSVRLSLTTDWTWKSTVAVNQITLTPLTAAVNWAAGSSLTVYGIPPIQGT